MGSLQDFVPGRRFSQLGYTSVQLVRMIAIDANRCNSHSTQQTGAQIPLITPDGLSNAEH